MHWLIDMRTIRLVVRRCRVDRQRNRQLRDQMCRFEKSLEVILQDAFFDLSSSLFFFENEMKTKKIDLIS